MEIRELIATRGKEVFKVLVDIEDYYKLQYKKLYVNKEGHVRFCETNEVTGRKSYKFIHRWILNAKDRKIKVDHKNRNKLDNRKENLRLCTIQQNTFNKKPKKGKFKGIYWNKKRKRWNVSIMKDYKYIHIGYFEDKIEAAKAYDKKAKELFGEFAYLNFPEDIN